MNIINHLFVSENKLSIFIEENYIKNESNVFIQIFSSNKSLKDLIKVRDILVKFLPNAHIIATSTAGIISDGVILDDNISLSFSIFQNSTIKIKCFKNQKHENIIADLEKTTISKETKLLIAFANTFSFESEIFLSKLSNKFPNLKVAGGNSADDYKFEKCFVISNDCDDCDIAFACIDSTVLNVQEKYLLNWLTLGDEFTVTKSDGIL